MLLDCPVNPTEENDSVAYPAARYASASVVAELGKRSGTCFTVWVVGYREVWIDGGDTFVQLACEMLARNRGPSDAIRLRTGAVSRR
jgi:hypothetical protein